MELDIVLDRTGGFAGLCLRAAVTADQLDTEPAGIAESLFTGHVAPAAAAPDDRPGRFPPPGMFAADAFTYRLELRSGPEVQTYEWPDPVVPAQVRPLLSALVRRAAPVDPPLEPADGEESATVAFDRSDAPGAGSAGLDTGPPSGAEEPTA